MAVHAKYLILIPIQVIVVVVKMDFLAQTVKHIIHVKIIHAKMVQLVLLMGMAINIHAHVLKDTLEQLVQHIIHATIIHA